MELFPESVDDVGLIVEVVLLLSLTSTKETFRVPDGVIFHWVPVAEERKLKSCPEAPCSVKMPATVWVVPAVKVKVSAAATVFDRLLNVVLPEMV